MLTKLRLVVDLHDPCFRFVSSAEFQDQPTMWRGISDSAARALDAPLLLSSNLALPHIPHEMGLQFLRAEFAANVQCTFLFGQWLAPWSKV
jgi:hypothetical protein